MAVINEAMARKFWSDRSPIGDRIAFSRRSWQVVGIVEDVHDRGARQETSATFYGIPNATAAGSRAPGAADTPAAADAEKAVAAELSRFGGRPKAVGQLVSRTVSGNNSPTHAS